MARVKEPTIMLTVTFAKKEHPTIAGLPIEVKTDLYDGRAITGHVEDVDRAIACVSDSVREALKRIGVE